MLRVVGSGAVAIGVLTAYGTVRMRLKAGQSHKWPTVPGKIVSSELESETERHNRKPITTYAAAIRYAYEVDGKAYESDQIVGRSGVRDEPAIPALLRAKWRSRRCVSSRQAAGRASPLGQRDRAEMITREEAGTRMAQVADIIAEVVRRHVTDPATMTAIRDELAMSVAQAAGEKPGTTNGGGRG